MVMSELNQPSSVLAVLVDATVDLSCKYICVHSSLYLNVQRGHYYIQCIITAERATFFCLY